jgi:endoglucanase
MKKIKILAAALCVFALAGNLLAAAPPFGTLSVQGNRIVGENGEPAVFRGMSFFWTTWGNDFYTAASVNTLVNDWKATVVRAAMDPGRRGSWKTVVDAAVSQGIYAVIDWHTHNHGTQNDAVTFFREQATAYKNVPNVIFEIFNEPCPSGEQEGKCSGDNWKDQIKPYSVAVINAIRATGAQNLIVIGSPDYSKVGNAVIADPVKGSDLANASYASNLVYSVHYYTAEPGTEHQGGLRGVCTQALNAGLALMVTEWGLSEADGGQKNTQKRDTTEANLWFRYLDENYISWMNWSIFHKNEAASALTGGSGAGTDWQLSDGGRFVRNKLRLYSETRKLNVTTVPASGGGTVSGTKASYKHGDFVTLTATPADGWQFVGWSGAGSGTATSPTRIIYMNQDQNVTATFTEGGNLVSNGTFANTNGWTLAETAGGEGFMEVKSAGGLGVTVTKTGTVNLRQNIPLVNNTRYRLTFEARAVTPATRTVNVMLGSSGAYGSLAAELTTASKTFTLEFDMTGTSGNVTLAFASGNVAGEWIINNVRIESIGPADNTGVAAVPFARGLSSWSVSRVSGAAVLRGPGEVGAKVTLYDVRGKAVRVLDARDGMSLRARGIPAGNYFVVVRDAAGKEVFRSRVPLVQ